ncbi:pyridoxamine 5'-phosphate oxidase family protein [Prescottella equi]|uniref:pyridoxamine 5'-phosphate oxidase family protein n=1 Tax=Rhodococcus hoagii TaxID=43767 RepID=UPI00384FDEBB
MSAISTVAELEAIYGEQPPLTLEKSISVLDEHCVAFLSFAPFAVLGVQGRSGAQHSVIVGGDPGTLTAEHATALRVDVAGGVVPPDVEDGAPAGLVALVPGYGETLRVNGRVRRDGESVVLDVEEAFLHCARCVTRSKLWRDHQPSELAPTTMGGSGFDDPHVLAFLGATSFLTLSSTDAGGHGDVSPKGDDRGFLVPLDSHRIALPDRPGNRRTDTFRNLLANPAVSLLALVPGDDRVLEVRGTAHVTTDPAVRARVQGGGVLPELALVIDAERVDLRHEDSLQASGLWRPDRRIPKGALPTAGAIWTAHVGAS